MSRRGPAPRPPRARAVLIGAALAGGSLLGIWGVTGALRVHALHQELDATERDIAALQVKARRLTEAIDRLRNDPAYLEKLAREEHGFVREGETVLKFPPRPK